MMFEYEAKHSSDEPCFSIHLNKAMNVIFDEEAKRTEDFILGKCCDYLNEYGLTETSDFFINAANLREIVNGKIPKDAIGLRMEFGHKHYQHTYMFKYLCPTCGKESVSYDRNDKYCPKCGQKFSERIVDSLGCLHDKPKLFDAEL